MFTSLDAYYNLVISMKYRTEFDSIGKIKVPGDKYWASTQRSNKYF